MTKNCEMKLMMGGDDKLNLRFLSEYMMLTIQRKKWKVLRGSNYLEILK